MLLEEFARGRHCPSGIIKDDVPEADDFADRVKKHWPHSTCSHNIFSRWQIRCDPNEPLPHGKEWKDDLALILVRNYLPIWLLICTT